MLPEHSKAVVEDIPTLNQISIQAKMYWKYPQEWLEKWREGLMITEGHFSRQQIYKLLLNDQIIGFCAIEESRLYYEIDHLWILPKYIGQGYGKFLLHQTLQKVVTKHKEIRVEADPNAEAFYASQGFVSYDQVESYPPGRYLPLMKK